MPIQYAGRTGRPFEYIAVTVEPTTLPDQCGGLFVSVAGTVQFTMKNASTATIALPIGFIAGDFRTITDFGLATVHAVLIST